MATRTNYIHQSRDTKTGRFGSNKNVSDLKVNQEPKLKRFVEFTFGLVIGIILLVLALDYLHVITLPVR